MRHALNSLVLGLQTDPFHQRPSFKTFSDLLGEGALLDRLGLEPSALEIHHFVDHFEAGMHRLRRLLGIDRLDDTANDAFLHHDPAIPFVVLIGDEKVEDLEDVAGDVLFDAEVALQRFDDVVSLPEHLHVLAVLLLEDDADDLDYGQREGQVGFGDDLHEHCEEVVDLLIDHLLHYCLLRGQFLEDKPDDLRVGLEQFDNKD